MPGLEPVTDLAGVHFHDLRHTHKSWLLDGQIPEVAQTKRLGHRLPDGKPPTHTGGEHTAPPPGPPAG